MVFAQVPNTLLKSGHALLIKLRNPNKVIGAVNNWSVRQQQQLTDAFEFGSVTRRGLPRGVPFDIGVGNVTGRTIDLRRFDLYGDILEDVFGSLATAMACISDRNDPFDLVEDWTAPANKPTEQTIYRISWFENTGRQVDAQGDRTINVNGVVRFLYPERVRT